jgi:hypothetical protein
MAPFFFFQQTASEGYSEIKPKIKEIQAQDRLPLKGSTKAYYQPLRGFTVIW